ncbi:MAG: thiamine phosphate synthase [Myxococcaceae bacterium]
MAKLIDLRLQLILEPHTKIFSLIEEAVKGGVTCVQWRDKFYNDRDFYDQAILIKELCQKLGVPLIINDRVDIALAIKADGVHLGKTDLAYDAARRIIPRSMILGGTAESLEDVAEAERYDLDYLGLITVFSSTSNSTSSKPFGLDGLRKARAISRHRLIATGGIKPENTKSIREIGIDGLGVASAICRAASHCEAAQMFAKNF